MYMYSFLGKGVQIFCRSSDCKPDEALSYTTDIFILGRLRIRMTASHGDLTIHFYYLFLSVENEMNLISQCSFSYLLSFIQVKPI